MMLYDALARGEQKAFVTFVGKIDESIHARINAIRYAFAECGYPV